MKYKNRRIAIAMLVAFEIILLVTVIFNIVAKDWRNLGMTVLAVINMLIPFLVRKIANKKEIKLPPTFEIITMIFVFLSLYLGEIHKFYYKFWWWDLLLHGIFGSYGVTIALYLKKGIIRAEGEVTKKRYTIFTLLFAFSFSITIGVIWEVFEFLGDYFFKTSMVKGGLDDTMADIIVKIVFAYITSVIYYYRNKK